MQKIEKTGAMNWFLFRADCEVTGVHQLENGQQFFDVSVTLDTGGEVTIRAEVGVHGSLGEAIQSAFKSVLSVWERAPYLEECGIKRAI